MAEAVPIVKADTATAIIASGASLSGAVALGNKRLAAILIPADTEGSVVTFQGSIDGVTFADLYGPSGEYSIAFTDPCVLIVPPADFLGLPFLKVRTGTSGSATNQSGAAATLTLFLA